jgi:hypothetical protein
MSYSKVTFSAITPLNLTNLNMLGCQYDEMVIDVEAHNHDSDYYTKILGDSTFVNESNDGAESGCNADTIDGLTKAQLTNSVMTNLIVWFFNASIPDGWHLCDGTNGTVNALNKYVIGADEETIFDTGGNDVFSPSVDLTVDEHVLTVDEIPSHRHDWTESQYYYSGAYPYTGTKLTHEIGSYKNIESISKNTGYAGSDQGHSHTGSVTINSVDNRPKSKALYLIQKI